tara:strand:+ start:2122 stop:2223 length:102 start_codon:yes stop_codon:yes gene_type:complete
MSRKKKTVKKKAVKPSKKKDPVMDALKKPIKIL